VDIQDQKTLAQRVDTDRFGPFTFQVGLDLQALELPLVRIQDAHRRFIGSPLAQVANRLEQEVLVESVHGTNTIEGGDLTPEETGAVLALPPQQIRAERELRVRNIKAAYDLAHATAANPKWRLDVDFLRTMHLTLCRDLPHENYQPGVIRNNPRNRITRVGNAAHGGHYKPPQYGRDIERLLQGLAHWHDTLLDAGVDAIIRAPLVHFYFERIHPCWDGNGRVGRVIEATLLLQAGFRYAPFALSRFYLEHIDAYFSLFNTCRKADEAGKAHPNQAFVAFHLDGMRQTLDALHDRVNRIVDRLLFDARLVAAVEAGELNARQYVIVRRVLDNGRPLALTELRQSPAYQSLYRNKTDKTKQRDLRRLRERGWLRLDAGGLLRPGFVAGRDDGVT
jgi:Fic family protein